MPVDRATRAACRTAALALGLVLTASPRSADAQSAPSVRVTMENDYFDFRLPPNQRPDHDYTHGVRLTAGSDRVIGWRRLSPSLPDCTSDTTGRCGSTTWELGQLMFTPTEDALSPRPGDRPYAGWLYATMTARREHSRTMEAALLTLGVTGPPSLAAQTHRFYHSLVPSFRKPLGWDHQLHTELAGAIGLSRSRLLLEANGAGSRVVDVVASGDVQAGTVRTAAGVAVRARAGYGVPHAWRTERRRTPLAFHVLAGARAEGVARDLFLDGSTFRASQRVRRRPVTGFTEVGFGARAERLLLEYRLVVQYRDYETGPARHPVGIIVVNVVP